MQENSRRSRQEPPFQLNDCDVFNENRYFDIDAIYAKNTPETILCRIVVTNRGPQTVKLHLLPTVVSKYLVLGLWQSALATHSR